jgi:hypothetical protein
LYFNSVAGEMRVWSGSAWAAAYLPAAGYVTLNGTETLTNKTIDGVNNTITNVSLTTGVTGTLPVANGGTGAATLTANSVLLGNGTSAVQVVAPGATGNVLTSDGTTWVSATPSGGGGGALTIDNKTAAYTVVAGDLGKIINCTANSFTVSLTAAATLGAGFEVTIWNTGTGVITIDPAGSETIESLSTWVLRQNEGTQIICDGTNWRTNNKKTMRAYAENYAGFTQPQATGSNAIALGDNAQSTNTASLALGSVANASGAGSVALGRNTTASSQSAVAIGQNSGSVANGSVAAGNGAMALGGSYASGSNSFAAAIANNTSSYGARSANCIAIGQESNSSNNQNCVAIGASSSATGGSCIALGFLGTASGATSVALSAQQASATATFSVAVGYLSLSNIIGKYAYASGSFDGVTSNAQTGTFVLRRATTDATPTILTTDNSAPGNNDQVILPNNSTYTFRVQVVAMQKASDGTNTAGYTFEGVIRRGANAAATVLKNSVKTVLQEDVAGWDCNVSADTTNGGLAVTVTGAASTNIRWVATVTTSEVTYA